MKFKFDRKPNDNNKEVKKQEFKDRGRNLLRQLNLFVYENNESSIRELTHILRSLDAYLQDVQNDFVLTDKDKKSINRAFVNALITVSSQVFIDKNSIDQINDKDLKNLLNNFMSGKQINYEELEANKLNYAIQDELSKIYSVSELSLNNESNYENEGKENKNEQPARIFLSDNKRTLNVETDYKKADDKKISEQHYKLEHEEGINDVIEKTNQIISELKQSIKSNDVWANVIGLIKSKFSELKQIIVEATAANKELTHEQFTEIINTLYEFHNYIFNSKLESSQKNLIQNHYIRDLFDYVVKEFFSKFPRDKINDWRVRKILDSGNSTGLTLEDVRDAVIALINRIGLNNEIENAESSQTKFKRTANTEHKSHSTLHGIVQQVGENIDEYVSSSADPNELIRVISKIQQLYDKLNVDDSIKSEEKREMLAYLYAMLAKLYDAYNKAVSNYEGSYLSTNKNYRNYRKRYRREELEDKELEDKELEDKEDTYKAEFAIGWWPNRESYIVDIRKIRSILRRENTIKDYMKKASSKNMRRTLKALQKVLQQVQESNIGRVRDRQLIELVKTAIKEEKALGIPRSKSLFPYPLVEKK